MNHALRLCVKAWLSWCWICSSSMASDDMARLQGAVVKITSDANGLQRTGSGFVVRIEPDAVYIITAAHVIGGDNRPSVEFFARRDKRSTGQVIDKEYADPKGLGLLRVEGKRNFPTDLPLLPINSGAALEPGDEVTAIGFPKGGADWSVNRMTVSGRKGRELELAGTVDEGSSGGPVIRGGEVVAVMVDMKDKFGLAVPGEVLQASLRGWSGRWGYGCQFSASIAKLHARPTKLSNEAIRIYQQAQQFQDEKRFGDAVRVLEQATRLGDFVATTDLAFLIWSGLGVAQDQAEALRLFDGVCQAAKIGKPLAQAAVARSYLIHHPWLIKDSALAIAWMKAAAEQGQSNAQVGLGSIYVIGKEVPQDFGEAVKWFRRAAEAGDVFGQYNLAKMYAEGRGVDRNQVIALHWYRKAADQGLVGAITAVGIAHMEGGAAPRDEALAARLLLHAARLGDSNAQYLVAMLYASGRGVPKDPAQAVEWWRKSARLGDKRAQRALSLRGVVW